MCGAMELLEVISQKIKNERYKYQTYEDLYYIAKEELENDEMKATKYLKFLSDRIEWVMIHEPLTDEEVVKLFELHKQVLLAGAKNDFEMYLLYVEWEREPSKKFYPPRRKALHPIVEALQELEMGNLELLAISLPPGVGKTTLAIFYLTWIAGRHPNEPSLTGSHSNNFIRGVYDECLRIFDGNGEYLWGHVFPGIRISNTNAKDCRIDLDKRQRFETLEFTSIGTGNAGLYRASRLLYCDDLVSGLEVALSEERLQKLWDTYTTDLRQRKIGDHAKELHIATRWSVRDVIGRLQLIYGDSPKARFISVPAVNEQDESNFEYPYGVGFSTEFYHQQRDIMDDVSWRALYMNEPIERSGLLYDREQLRRYFDLPTGEPDAILAVCDTKDKGKDYCAMPIMYKYGEDYFLADVICDNANPDIVEPRLIECLLHNKVQFCRFESNSAGGRVAQVIQQELKKRGGVTNITTKFTTSNKETRIIVNSSWIKEHVLFKDDSLIKPNTDYWTAMNQMCTYTMMGKNAHDDFVDSLGMFVEFAQTNILAKVEIFKRPW